MNAIDLFSRRRPDPSHLLRALEEGRIHDARRALDPTTPRAIRWRVLRALGSSDRVIHEATGELDADEARELALARCDSAREAGWGAGTLFAQALVRLDRGDLDGASLLALDAERLARARGAHLDRALATALLAAIDTMSGRDGWSRVKRTRVEAHGTPAGAIFTALRALSLLERAGALAHVRRSIASSLAARTHEGRLVLAIAERAIAARSTWRIAADGSFADRPDGTRIVLAPRRLLMRLCAALARARVERPGESVPIAALIAAGWPGERMMWRAAENRLRVALARLRTAGLEPIVRTARGGYLLDPEIALTLANGGEGI